VRRWQNGNILSVSPANTAFGESFTIHRADLHNALIDRALALENIELRVNSLVTDVRFDSTEIVLADGAVISGDVIIAADGIKSVIRGKLLNDTTVKPTATGDAAYRIILPRSKMLSNPELKLLVDTPKATRWIGPARHIIAYPVRNHQLYNVVLLHPDRGTVDESWTTRGSKQQMIDDYAGWDEKVCQIVSMVEEDEVLEWKLCLYPPLKTWTKGSVALMGDSCHPML
jgi:salicylate hydroxylase